MKIYINSLNTKPNLIITNFKKINELTIKQINLIKNNSINFNITCTSILTKITKNKYIIKITNKYKKYKFKKHKKYYTKKHTKSIIQYKTTPKHKLTYKNIKKTINIYKQKKFYK